MHVQRPDQRGWGFRELPWAPDRSSKGSDERHVPCYGGHHTARRRVVFFLTRGFAALERGRPSRAVVAAGAVVRVPPGPRQAGGVMTVTDTQATWLTQEAYDRLKRELYELFANRPVTAGVIIARGDAGARKEDGGYHAARDEQGQQEARIRQLQELLRTA